MTDPRNDQRTPGADDGALTDNRTGEEAGDAATQRIAADGASRASVDTDRATEGWDGDQSPSADPR